MTDRNISIPPVPKRLLSTVGKCGEYPLQESLLGCQFGPFKKSKEFEAWFNTKEVVKLPGFFDKVTEGQSALYRAFISFLFAMDLKKSKEFLLYLTDNQDGLLAKIATDGKSEVYKSFHKHCVKEKCEDQLECLVKFRRTMAMADNYIDFMKSFNDVMAHIEDINILGSDKKELTKMHDKYWDAEKHAPKDVLKLHGTTDDDTLEKNMSNLDLATNEKKAKTSPKGNKTKTKTLKSAEDGDHPNNSSPLEFVGRAKESGFTKESTQSHPNSDSTKEKKSKGEKDKKQEKEESQSLDGTDVVDVQARKKRHQQLKPGQKSPLEEGGANSEEAKVVRKKKEKGEGSNLGVDEELTKEKKTKKEKKDEKST